MKVNTHNPMLPEPYEVQKVLRETHNTFTINLKPRNRNLVPSFIPGQFNMIYLYGVGEIPISMSGNTKDVKTAVHTIRSVGTVTQGMQKLRRDHTLGVRGPFGSHWPIDEAIGNDVLIVAGGIGLAPLRPAIYQFISQREKYGRIVILYGTRSPEDILFRKEIERWRRRLDLEIHVTVDRSTGKWDGYVGVVTMLIPNVPFDPLNTLAMICGPEIMMRYTIMELQKLGLEENKIHISMERNMKCAIGFCGRCQFGPNFICKDGPIFRYDNIQTLFGKREV